MTNRKKINSARVLAKLVFSFALLFLVFYSCKKSNSGGNAVTPCICPDPITAVDSSSIVGCWVLTDTMAYSKFSPDSIWVQNTIPVVIKFNTDSSFCHDTTFTWGFAHYTGVGKQSSGLLQMIPPEDNGWYTYVTLAGHNELILDRTNAISGVKQRYKRQ
jgi:hypothetical protein